jgi:hypothetical protein
VQRRQDHELVGVELDQIGDLPQQSVARVQRRVRKALLQRVEDLAGVLQRLVVCRHHHRNERQAGALQDDVAVRLRRGQDLDVRDALVAQRRPHLGGEV